MFRVIVWIQMQQEITDIARGLDRLVPKDAGQDQEVQTLQMHVKTLTALFDDAEEFLRLSEPVLEKESAKSASPTSVDAPTKPKEQPQEAVCGWTVNNTSDDGSASHDLLMTRIRKMLQQPEIEAPAPKTHNRSDASGPVASASPSAAKHHRHSISKSRLMNYEAEKVLDVRGSRNSVRDYLVQWKDMAEPIWVPRSKCPEQAKQLIKEFSKARGSQTRRNSHMLAQARLNPSAVHSPINKTTNDIFIVDKIVDHKMRYGKKYYFVKWEGYTDDDNTWERADKLRQEVAAVVEQYEQQRAREKARAVSKDDQQRQSESEGDEATKPLAAKRLKRGDENTPREQEFDDESDIEFPFVQYDDEDLDNEHDNSGDLLEDKIPVPTHRSVGAA